MIQFHSSRCRAGGRHRGRGALAAVRLAITLTTVFLAVGAVWAQGTVSGTVRDPGGEPVADAIVRVAGGRQRTTTGDDGTYSLSLPEGRHRLLVTAPGYGTAGSLVTVSADQPTTVDFELSEAISQFGESVVVIGSRAERTAVETPVPVDVLTTEDIEDSGQTETARIVQFLAPSFNFSTSTISDGTDIVRPSTLRGLGPDQTLVLVNGKRRHNSALIHVNGSIGRGTAGVDLNAIPPGAIETIEVLRDGAAAQYGSDAIAGVLNVQLKRSTGVTRVELNTGQQFEGDGELVQANVNRGWKIGDEGGFVNATFAYRDRGFTNRAGRDPRQIFNFQEQMFGQPQLTDSDGDGTCDQGGSCTLDPREATYDRLNHRYGDAESENLYLFGNGEVPLSEDSDVYFFGGISSRDGESAGFNRLPGQSRTNIIIHPEGHLPLINTDVDDESLAVGIRKSLSDNWSVDASVTNGENQFNFFISNSANTSLGAASPRSADAGTLSFGQTTFNVDFFGVAEAGVIPVAVAFGVEYRQDRYEIDAGESASYVDGGVTDQFGGTAPAGIQVFPGFRPSNEVDEDRDNIAVYGDLEFDISDRFLLGLATRFEDYTDFGENVSGKVAARFEITEQWAIRASASTGFRAPSLHQTHFNNISTQFVDVGGVITPLEVGTFRVSSPVARALGARPLEEETSVGYSAGFTGRPRRNLSITADVFQVDIEDRIVLSGRFPASNPQIAPLLAPFNVNAAQFFTNAIDTTTEGADVVVAWSRPIGRDASLSLTGAANWNKTQLDSPIRTPSQLAGLGETLFDDIEVTYLERGQPRELYNLAARYRKRRFAGLVRFNKFGAVASTESASDPARKQVFSGKWITDLDLSYRFGDGARIAIGANNLFDVFPDKQIPSNNFNGIFIYPRRVAPFGFNGGSYYVNLSFELE